MKIVGIDPISNIAFSDSSINITFQLSSIGNHGGSEPVKV